MENKKEYVGKVELDYTYYGGKDEYSEGEVEDELLEIVKNHKKSEFHKIIMERGQWSVLYHLSEVRGNILSWIDRTEGKVLEIGSGCGAITGTIAGKFKKVDCVELSKRRSLINAYRNRDADNISIKVGNFQDIESSLDRDYDAVTLIGVLEYAELYINSKDAYRDFLNMILGKLKCGGKLYIAIENKLGLKYFAGSLEDHLAKYYVGIEGYPFTNGVRTFSKKELQKMLDENESIAGYRFMYPYPDYKLPRMIYTDEYQPTGKELDINHSVSGYKLKTFDEQRVFEQLINEGLFTEFSNSFLLEIVKGENV